MVVPFVQRQRLVLAQSYPYGYGSRSRREAEAVIRRSFLASSFSSNQEQQQQQPPPLLSCDVVKGPSLLRTTVHRPRPSLLHLPGLRSLPFWTQKHKDVNQPTRVAYQDPSLTWAVQHFEQNWQTILQEYKELAPSLQSDYQVDTEHHTLHQGTWEWHSYMLKGRRQGVFQQKFVETSKIISQVRDMGLLFEHVPFGYAFFSTLHPKSRIAAHSAPMNFRVRMHLPLIVPNEEEQNNQTTTESSSEKRTTATELSSDPLPKCGIRVASSSRPWLPGKCLLLDDAFDHQVWNETDTARVVLLVDFWHPDIDAQERRDIIDLFDHAKKQGWWSST